MYRNDHGFEEDYGNQKENPCPVRSKGLNFFSRSTNSELFQRIWILNSVAWLWVSRISTGHS